MEKRSHLVTFYRNGDPHFRGLTATVNQKYFASLESLQLWLNEKIETTAGCRFIFRLADGKLVKDIDEIEAGQSYVVSSVKKFITDCAYGQNKEHFWYNRKPTEIAGFRTGEQTLIMESRYKKDHQEVEPQPKPAKRGKKPLVIEPRPRRRSDPERTVPRLQKAVEPAVVIPNGSGGMRKVQKQPRVITIVSNTSRNSWRRVLINPNSSQPFESMLHDFTDMVTLARPPCLAMYTAEPPFKRVTSFSQLLREQSDSGTFIVCGQEYLPLEIQATQRSPQENSETPVESTPQPVVPTDIKVLIKGKEHTFHQPSNASALSAQLSNTSKVLQLNWVYGFDVRKPKSLLVAPQGELVYFIGNLVILHNPNTDKQRFYTDHRKTITALAMHASGDLAASAEIASSHLNSEANVANGITFRRNGAQPKVCVWATGDLTTLATIQHASFKSHSVLAIDFLPEAVHGHELLLLANDASPFNIFVVDWRAKQLLAQVETSHSHFGQSRFHIFNSPFEAKNGYEDEQTRVVVVTSGKHHLSLWQLALSAQHAAEPYQLFHVKTVSMASIVGWKDRDRNSDLDGTESLSSAHDGKATITAIECDFHSVILGDSNGAITVWRLPGSHEDGEADDIHARTSAAAIPLDDDSMLPEGAVIAEDGKVQFPYDQPFTTAMLNRSKRPKALFSGRHRMFQLRNAHEKAIVSLCFFNDGTLISTGADNEIKAWDTMSEYQLVKSRSISKAYGTVVMSRAKNSNLIDGVLYLLTSNAHILEGSLQTKFISIMHSHGSPVQCLAVHSREHTFVTCCAAERLVCKWSAISHRVLWKSVMDKAISCCTMHPDGSLVALGTPGGQIILVNSESGQHVVTYQITKGQVSLQGMPSRANRRITDESSDDDDVSLDSDFLTGSNSLSLDQAEPDTTPVGYCNRASFSPSGFLLAVASRNGIVHILASDEQQQSYQHLKVKDGTIRLSDAIRELDWSSDSCYLQVVTDTGDHSFWYVPELKSVTPVSCRNTKWATLSCTLGYHTAKIWQQIRETGRSSTVEITACTRSFCRDLLCVGYSEGTIELVNFFKTGAELNPVKQEFTENRNKGKKSPFKKIAEDSPRLMVVNRTENFRRVKKTTVLALQFLFDDSFLLSLQQDSNLVLQWKLLTTYTD